MDEVEENSKNPTIVIRGKVEAPHYFILKYRNEAERTRFSTEVMRLIKKYELKDFHVEEKKAFLQNRIIYNMHTISEGSQVNSLEVEKAFLKHLRD